MPQHQDPDDWRRLLRDAVSYDYPEETHHGKRRERRRKRKEYREDHRRESANRLDEARRKEPITAGAAILVIGVILVIGWLSQWLKGGNEEEGREAVKPAPTESQVVPDNPEESESTGVEEEEDRTTPHATAEGWARVYWERNPPKDGEFATVVDRSSGYMAAALAENLKGYESDPQWSELVSNGGIAEVKKVAVKKADPKLGANAPGRQWRKVVTATDVEGYTKYKETHTVSLEMMLADDGTWEITRIHGLKKND